MLSMFNSVCARWSVWIREQREIKHFLIHWVGSLVVLFFPYCALYVLGWHPLPLMRVLISMALLGAVFTLLIEFDREKSDLENHVGPDSARTHKNHVEPEMETSPDNRATLDRGSAQKNGVLSQAIVDLFVRRQSLLAFFALAAAVSAVAFYYVFTSLFPIQYTPGSGVLVSLPGKTVYYLPIDPMGHLDHGPMGVSEEFDVGGWQNTNIFLQKDEWFSFELSGRVSPGALRIYPVPPDESEPAWPFTGPEGYRPDWYGSINAKRKWYIDCDFRRDRGLTVMGVPHNTVVGIIMPDTRPLRAIDKRDQYQQSAEEEECPDNFVVPGYDLVNKLPSEEIPYLIDFSCDPKLYPGEYQAKRSGLLWVEINDADGARSDDAGFFFLKLTKHLGGLHSESSEQCNGSFPQYVPPQPEPAGTSKYGLELVEMLFPIDPRNH